MTEKRRESGYRQTERTLNEEVRSLRGKLARVEHAKGEHEELTELYRALVDNSAQGLAVIENGRIVFANRNMETLTGYSVEELNAMSAEQVRTLVHPEDQQAVWTRHRDRLSGEDPENPYDFRLIHRNGTVRWLRLHASRITYHGREAVQAAYVDVTEQKKAEEREAHVKRVLLAIRNVNQLIVAETDRQRLIEQACGSLTETLGYFNAWIALLDEGSRVVTMTGASGFDGYFEPMCERLERGDFPACMREALQDDATVVVSQPKEDCPDCPLASGYGNCAGLARCLAFNGKVYGVLIVSVPVPFAHDVEERDLFKELADDLGFALHRIEAAEALCNSEARYRRFVETALEGIWAMNPEHETTFVNERMASMLGYAPQQMLGRKVEDFMFEEDLPAHRRRMQNRRQGKGGQYEHRFRRADGREVWTRVSATAIVSEQGQFGGSFAMFTDITERKRAIQALERSETRYRTLFENSPIGIGLAELGGHVLTANPAMEELFGYSAQELEHLDIADLYEDSNDRMALLKQIKQEGCVQNYPAQMKCKDGHQIEVLVSSSLIQSEGQMLLQTMCIDVTEQRHAEQALRESEQKFRAIADYTYDLEIWVDMDGRLVWMNSASERFCGYSVEECATMPDFPSSLIHEDDRARVLSLYKEACQGGSGSDIWFRMVCRNDSIIWVSASWQSIHTSDGYSLGWRCSLRDISDRVRAEEKLQRSEKKFRSLFESMGSGCCVDEVIYENGKAVDYRILDVNPAYERIMGISRDRAVGALGSEVYGTGKAPFLDTLARVAETGEPASFESYFAPIEKYLQFTVSRPAQGRFSTVFTDVTDRKRAEEALRDSERRLRESQKIGRIGHVEFNIETRNILWADMMYDLYERDPAFGPPTYREVMALHDPEDASKLECHVRRAAETGEPYALDLRVNLPSGHEAVYHAIGTPVRDATGKVTRIIGTVQDVTERKRAEEQLRLMSEMLDTAPSSITVHDFEGRFVYANRKTFDIHRYAEHEFMALNLRQLDVPASESLIVERMESIATEGEACFEVEHFRRDGSTVPLEIYAKQVTWESTPAILGIWKDITDRKRAEEELQRHRAELQAIYDHAPVMMCVLGADRQVLYANRALAQFTGKPEIDLKGGRACGVFGCVNALADPRGCGFAAACRQCNLLSALEDTQTTGDSHKDIEYCATLELENGRKDVILLGATALMHTQEDEPRLLLCLQDITTRVRAEQELQRTTDLLRAIRDAQSLFIGGGESRDVYETLLSALVGLTESQYGFLDEVCEDDRGLYKRSLAMSNIAWDAESRRLYQHLVNNDLEFRNVANLAGVPALTGELVIANDPSRDARSGGLPEGHPALNAYMGIPLFFEDKVVGVAGVANRASGYDERLAQFLEPFVLTCAGLIEAGRKKAREAQYIEALRQSEETALALLDTPGLSILLMEPQGKILDLNATFAEVFAAHRTELVGRSIWECWPADRVFKGKEVLDQVLCTGQSRHYEESHGDRWRDVTVHPFLDSQGKISRILIVSKDITEQKLAQQKIRQREAEILQFSRLSTLGEMASGLAHELSQPLSAILNYSTACMKLASAELPDAPRIAGNLTKIVGQAERARDIMMWIKAFAQRHEPHLTSVDMNQAATGVLDLLAWEIRRGGIHVNLDLANQLPAARADVVQIEQVLLNLTRNAIEAMDQTPPTCKCLTIRTGSDDAGTIRVEVSDTGVGIPDGSPERIFDAFVTTKADGLGIGLSISRTIVEMHKGTLNATRNPESGSTFVLVLPTVSGPNA